jgi:hypothetical protein
MWLSAGRPVAFTYDDAPTVRKSAAQAIADRLVPRTGPESYGGGNHRLVNASIAEQAEVLSQALKGRMAAIAEWAAFNDSAPELARLTWNYLDNSYGEMLRKSEAVTAGSAAAPTPRSEDAELLRLANSGNPALREWAQRRLSR